MNKMWKAKEISEKAQVIQYPKSVEKWDILEVTLYSHIKYENLKVRKHVKGCGDFMMGKEDGRFALCHRKQVNMHFIFFPMIRI